MAQPKKILRLVHAPGGFCDVMIQANIALSDGRPEEAICQYTEVLYKLQPANVCAFLNRSMAFLDYGYYELAVMDAYRACNTASELRKDTQVADNRLCKLAKYIRAERLHVDKADKWTRPEQRNTGIGWAESPLASIVVSATPEVTVPQFGLSKKSIIKALEIRAAYRLCGALFMVGDGARMDALSLIDDARVKLKMSPWESDWFHKLGNQIMDQVTSEVDPTDPKELRLLGHDTRDKRNERMMKLKENMKGTTTHFAYGDYPWDPYEPKLGESEWQKQAQAWVESCSDNCSALVVQPEETENTPAEGSKPYVELRANRDINSGDLVLSEQTIYNVTTSIPEQIAAKRRAGKFDYYYCNSCASLLAVHQQCSNRFQSSQTPVKPENAAATPTLSSLTLSSENSNNTARGNHSIEAGSTKHAEQQSSTNSAPYSLAQSFPYQDFMFCRQNHILPTCSAACRELGKDFDNGICGTKIEQGIRQSHFHDLKPRSMTDCKTQCLRDLVFLRNVTMAVNLNKSPLNANDIMFATSGPNMRGMENSVVEPWSFASHVLRPVNYLHQLFENMGIDQYLKLSQVDGWIINTLLIKINRAMHILKGPRYVKCFRADGMLDTAFGPWDERCEGLPKLPKRHEDKSVWIASIDSLFNMIRIADPALGETPNVTVIQREGVNVYAITTDDGGPAIKAGEPLLRAPDDVQGPALLGKKLYAEDLQDQMEETCDGDEAHSGDTSDCLEEFSDEEEDLGDAHDGDEGRSGDTSDFLEEFSADEDVEDAADEEDVEDASDEDGLGGEVVEVDGGGF